MKCALLTLTRLEPVQVVEETNRPPKIEFTYLKLLSRQYSGSRRIATARHVRGHAKPSPRMEAICAAFWRKSCPAFIDLAIRHGFCRVALLTPSWQRR